MKKINFLALIPIIIVNALFSYKYLSRIVDHALLATTIYCTILFVLPIIFHRITGVHFLKFLVIIAGIYVIADIILLWKTDPINLKVDRWSVITSFLDALFSGQFPYTAKSHMGNAPGPFPFYYFLALPFYLLGEIGYFSLSGFILLIYFIIKYFDTNQNRIIVLSLFLFSISIFWELSVRSAILINSSLVLVYINWISAKSLKSIKELALIGFIAGLLISTRGLVVIPFAVCYSYLFLKPGNWKGLFVSGVSAVLGFIITILPLIIWDYKLFLQFNPITLQAEFIPFSAFLLFIIGSILAGFICKNMFQVYLSIGIILFITVSTYFIYNTYLFGIDKAI
jgi:hypothetical protein